MSEEWMESYMSHLILTVSLCTTHTDQGSNTQNQIIYNSIFVFKNVIKYGEMFIILKLKREKG